MVKAILAPLGWSIGPSMRICAFSPGVRKSSGTAGGCIGSALCSRASSATAATAAAPVTTLPGSVATKSWPSRSAASTSCFPTWVLRNASPSFCKASLAPAGAGGPTGGSRRTEAGPLPPTVTGAPFITASAARSASASCRSPGAPTISLAWTGDHAEERGVTDAVSRR